MELGSWLHVSFLISIILENGFNTFKDSIEVHLYGRDFQQSLTEQTFTINSNFWSWS
jgi:hypothetical protein